MHTSEGKGGEEVPMCNTVEVFAYTYVCTYVAESIATDCRTVRPCRPSSTVYLTKFYMSEVSCNQLLLID